MPELDLVEPSVWTEVPAFPDLAPGATTVIDAGGTRLFVCRLGSELLAYHDLCVGCGGSLAGAVLTGRSCAMGEALLGCLGCDATYDVCRSGTSVSDASSHLTQVPLLVEGRVVSVAVAVAVPVATSLPPGPAGGSVRG